MNRKMFRGIVWILILQLIVGPAALWAQTDAAKKETSTFETMLNYDYKTYAGKVIVQQIREDLAAGRPVNFAKIKKELTDKPFLTQAAIGGGSEVVANAFQFGMAGVWPPFGMIAGSTVAAVFQSFGGAVGYETSETMKSGEKLTPKQVLGKALSSIDMPEFIGQTTGSVVGSMVGQALIPIPVVGMIIGGIVGGLIGGTVVNQLRKIPAVASAFDALQKKWEKIGKSLMKKNPDNQQEPDESPQTTAKAATAASAATETPANTSADDLMNVAPTVESATTGNGK